MQVVSLLLFETGTYNDHVLRPYQMTINGSHINQLVEATAHGERLTAEAFAPVAGQILTPVSEAQAPAQIANGWDTKRFMFILKLELTSSFGMSTYQYLSGYTNHFGISHGQHLDPNMRLFFNSSVVTRSSQITTPYGVQTQTHIASANQLLNAAHIGPAYNNQGGHFNNNPVMMRPEDIFTTINIQGIGVELSDIYQVGTGFQDGPRMSKWSNNSAPDYLSRIMTSHRQAVMDSADAEDPVKINGRARDLIREGMMSSDPFIGSNLLQGGTTFSDSITLGELYQISPGLETSNRIEVILMGAPQRAAAPARGVTEYWNIATLDASIAAILSNSIPAALINNMLTSVQCRATNRTLDGQWYLQILGTGSFIRDVDTTQLVEGFKSRMVNRVLLDVSRNNMIPMELTMNFNMVGNSYIEVLTQGSQPTRFDVASFTDGLFSPVISGNAYALHDLSGDLRMVTDHIAGSATTYTPAYTPPIHTTVPNTYHSPAPPMAPVAPNHDIHPF